MRTNAGQIQSKAHAVAAGEMRHNAAIATFDLSLPEFLTFADKAVTPDLYRVTVALYYPDGFNHSPKTNGAWKVQGFKSAAAFFAKRRNLPASAAEKATKATATPDHGAGQYHKLVRVCENSARYILRESAPALADKTNPHARAKTGKGRKGKGKTTGASILKAIFGDKTGKPQQGCRWLKMADGIEGQAKVFEAINAAWAVVYDAAKAAGKVA